MKTPIPCRKCQTLYVMTEGSVITSCVMCNGKQKPLVAMPNHLKKLEELVNGMIKVIPDKITYPLEFPEDLVRAFFVKEQGYNKALQDVLAKIAELRENG